MRKEWYGNMKRKRILCIFLVLCIQAFPTMAFSEQSPSSKELINESLYDLQNDKITDIVYEEDKSTIEIDKSVSQNGLKQEKIKDKIIDFKYVESVESVGIQVHGRNVYTSDEGKITEYDNVTGQLVFYSNDQASESKNKISENDALDIVQKFIQQYCDLSKYTLCDITYNQYTGFNVQYSKYILGYKTSEIIWVCLADNGEVKSFVYNPYVFDNVTVNKIDEGSILSKLENDIKSQHSGFISYKIKDKRLAINEDNKVVLEFFVSIESSDINGATGSVFSYLV